MAVRETPKTTAPGHAARRASNEVNNRLDAALEATFPSSDTPEMVQPGAGITGAEVKPSQLSPSQLARSQGKSKRLH
ncbi:MAG: hypothetical protein P0Y66_19815 [Candidatus Kaistia colombiensis]|nr:MAG: hypothetical protein P0Y66_19815 [Kaistia sp.]